MDHVIKVVTRVVNIIRRQGLIHRQFKEFLDDIDSEFEDLLHSYSVVECKQSYALYERINANL